MKISFYLPNLIQWFLAHGLKIIGIIVGAVLVNWFLKTLITNFIKDTIKAKISEETKKKRAATLISSFYGTAHFIVIIVALLAILSELGINITPILASLGVAGLAVSMAAKDIIADFISGLFILLEGQFYVGDKVKIADIEGVVQEFTLRKTIIRDSQGVLHIIPNSQIKIVAKEIPSNQ